MSQRREIEARLALFDELSGILSAMRSFALTELHRVGKRETAQELVVQSLSVALDEVSFALKEHPHEKSPASSKVGKDIWILLGSVRGFCGSFNEDVIGFWRTQSQNNRQVFLLGEKLHELLDKQHNVEHIPGADSGLNAAAAIDRILAALGEAFATGTQENRLLVCLRDEQGARCQQLWPLAQEPRPNMPSAPMTYMPIAEVAIHVAEHFLYHSLLGLLLRSIKVENHMRLMQMENALRHLQQGSEEMQRQRNRLRQEEIVEEIELIVCGKHQHLH